MEKERDSKCKLCSREGKPLASMIVLRLPAPTPSPAPTVSEKEPRSWMLAWEERKGAMLLSQGPDSFFSEAPTCLLAWWSSCWKRLCWIAWALLQSLIMAMGQRSK